MARIGLLPALTVAGVPDEAGCAVQLRVQFIAAGTVSPGDEARFSGRRRIARRLQRRTGVRASVPCDRRSPLPTSPVDEGGMRSRAMCRAQGEVCDHPQGAGLRPFAAEWGGKGKPPRRHCRGGLRV